MKLLRFVSKAALRGLRLPLDALFLSFDLCRLMLWVLWTGLLRLLGKEATSWGPFCAGAESVEAQTLVCPAARKYGSLFLLQALCPAVQATDAGERVCRHARDYEEETYVPPWGRVVLLGLALFVGWAGLGAAGVVAWSRRPSGEPRHESTAAPLARAAGPSKGAEVVAVKKPLPRPDANPTRKPPQSSPARETQGTAALETPATDLHTANQRSEEFVQSGDAYFAKGQFTEAVIEYKNAIQQDRSNARARLGLALSYLRSRRVREAREELLEAVRLDPPLAEAHAQLCQAELARQDSTRAIEHARKLKELKPDDPQGYVLLSACHEVRGD